MIPKQTNDFRVFDKLVWKLPSGPIEEIENFRIGNPILEKNSKILNPGFLPWSSWKLKNTNIAVQNVQPFAVQSTISPS